ncbi:MAG: hypothetical protein JJ896_03860 [Rhodothermales bacterium]|nr:hypothetical protein [Rhodothermales bacterium]MBO6778771.1 hypothetical protein [Rhodothermales bacterium]
MNELSGVAYLMAMPQYGLAGDVALKPGLARIRALLAAMGRPDRGMPIMHVAGTNGKGSTASFAAAILTSHGLRTGLHTSPHLLHPGERMRVNGIAAPHEWLDQAVETWRPAIEGTQASYFEATVALSLLRFAEENVDAAVVEVGLGGRLDATNVLDTAVSVITRVALDHAHILGNSVQAIASEKAGIIRPGIPVVLGKQDLPAAHAIRETALKLQAPLIEAAGRWKGSTLNTPSRRLTHLKPGLEQAHQRENAATGVLASEILLDILNVPLLPRAVRSGLRHVRRLSGLRARYEILSREPLCVVDVAHNPDALIPVLQRFRRDAGPGEARVRLGLMADKELEPVAVALRELNLSVEVVNVASPRAINADTLAEKLRAAGVSVVDPEVASTVPRLVTGSHQVVEIWLREYEDPVVAANGL